MGKKASSLQNIDIQQPVPGCYMQPEEPAQRCHGPMHLHPFQELTEQLLLECHQQQGLTQLDHKDPLQCC